MDLPVKTGRDIQQNCVLGAQKCAMRQLVRNAADVCACGEAGCTGHSP